MSKSVLTFGKIFCIIHDMLRLPRWLRFNLMYFGRPPWDTGISPPELMEFIQQNRPGRAIDLGCGTGTNLVTLGKAGWQVTGVDFAMKAVFAARRKMRASNVHGEVRAGDVSRLETVRSRDSSRYDLVLDLGCYHSLPEARRSAYRQNLAEILAPGGVLLLYAHWKRTEDGGSPGITQTDLEKFQEILELENRQDSANRWGRPAVWMRFRAR